MQDGSKMLFDTIAFIGVGLIGGSMARDIRAGGLARHLVGYARRAETREEIQQLGLVDQVASSLQEAVQDADLVVLCVPVGAMGQVAHDLAAHLKPGAVVTDVGSVKRQVLHDLRAHLKPENPIIGGHPLAGTENSGPSAALTGLYRNRWCVLTPEADTSIVALDKVRQLWEAMGSHVEVMDAEHHDKVLAITSHLPHLIAYCIVHTATGLEAQTQEEVIKFSASGFRDFTRIAASDPVMWRDIFLNNKDAVLEMLQRFSEDLTALQRSIRYGEGESLQQVFTETRAVRRSIKDAGQAGTFDAREPEAMPLSLLAPYASD